MRGLHLKDRWFASAIIDFCKVYSPPPFQWSGWSAFVQAWPMIVQSALTALGTVRLSISRDLKGIHFVGANSMEQPVPCTTTRTVCGRAHSDGRVTPMVMWFPLCIAPAARSNSMERRLAAFHLM